MLDSHDLKWDCNPKGFKNFVKAYAEYLPFKDGCFSEVYCSHLLEHLDKPETAIKELLRVSNHKVTIILPFALFQLLDFFLWNSGRKFVEHRRWLKKHHKRNYFGNPLKMGYSRLCFPNLLDALLYKKKAYGSKIKIPIPFETETVILK